MTPRRCNFLHLNVNGIRSRAEEIKPLLTACLIATFQDTRHRETKEIRTMFPEFHVYDVLTQTGRPGQAFLVHHSLQHHLIGIRSHLGQTAIKVALTNPLFGSPLHVTSYYSPPAARHDPLQRHLLHWALDHSNALLMGDLNACHPAFGHKKANENGKVLIDYIQIHHITVLNDTAIPTFSHVSHDYVACLDYVLATSTAAALMETCYIDTDVGSDHLPLTTTLRRYPRQTKPVQHKWHLDNKHDFEPYQHLLHNLITSSDIWPPTSSTTSYEVDHLYDSITQLITDAATATVPSLRPGCAQRPRVPHHVLLLIQLRRRLKKDQRRSPNTYTRRHINQISKEITRNIKEVKTNIERTRLAAVAQGPSHPRFWTEIRRHFRGPPNRAAYPIRNPDNSSRFLTTPIDIATAFQNYMKDLLSPTAVADSNAQSSPPPAQPSTDQLATQTQIHAHLSSGPIVPLMDLQMLRRILRHVRKKRAPGPDNIPYEFLAHGPPALHQVLLTFYNDVISQQYVPAKMMESVITMIPKPGRDPIQISNYRPLSLSNTILKVLEFHLNTHILNYAEAHSILHDRQLAFRRNHDTTEQLLEITECAIQTFNVGDTTAMVSLDLFKAFDTVNQDKLLDVIRDKLPCQQLRHLLSTLFRSRSTRIRYQGQHGTIFVPSRGLPQGSPLSPTLFNIYTADIPSPTTSKVVQYTYADDITLCSYAPSPTTALRLIQQQVDNLSQWLQDSELKLQPEKTQLLYLTRNRNPTAKPPLIIQGLTIAPKQTARVLGIIFDQRLSFTPHIQTLTNQLEAPTSHLRSIMSANTRIPRAIGVLLLRSLIRSKIDYGNPLLLCAPPSSWRLLTHAYHRAIRAATRSHRRTPLPVLHQRANLKPLTEHYEMTSQATLDRYIQRRTTNILKFLQPGPRHVRLAFTMSPLYRLFHSANHQRQTELCDILRELDLRPP